MEWVSGSVYGPPPPRYLPRALPSRDDRGRLSWGHRGLVYREVSLAEPWCWAQLCGVQGPRQLLQHSSCLPAFIYCSLLGQGLPPCTPHTTGSEHLVAAHFSLTHRGTYRATRLQHRKAHVWCCPTLRQLSSPLPTTRFHLPASASTSPTSSLPPAEGRGHSSDSSTCPALPRAGEKDEAFQTQLSILASHQSQDCPS